MNIVKRIQKTLGPGFITGVADDDPSGIITYAQTGALFGIKQLWLAVYSIPFMIAVQEMCARIGLVTGKGIAGVIKHHYSKWVLSFAVVLLTVANTINIGADLGAMGQALSMVSTVPSSIAIILMTCVTLVAIIVVPYHLYAKLLKYLAATVFSYILVAFFVHHNWKDIAIASLIPHLEWNRDYLLNVTAFLGTTISPYLFFWQADEEVEEEIDSKKLRVFGKGRPYVTSHDLKNMRQDTVIGMTLSNLIAFFIMITTSEMSCTGTGITSAAQIVEGLRPLAGDFAIYLFAFGILGTGLLAIPVLAGSIAYALGETFSLPMGLSKSFTQAVHFYSIIGIVTLLGALLNLIQVDSMHMLYYAAAINGILAAPLLFIILAIANNKKILGDKVNGLINNILVGTIAVCITLIAIFTIESLFR